MAIISMIVVGLIVGAIAKLRMPGRDPGGILVTMLVGIAGAMVAGVIGRAAGWYASAAAVSAALHRTFVLGGKPRLAWFCASCNHRCGVIVSAPWIGDSRFSL